MNHYKPFGAELLFIFKKTKLTRWSVGFEMCGVAAAGHSSLSVFAKVTNTKEKKNSC